jgi:hypothetical protein
MSVIASAGWDTFCYLSMGGLLTAVIYGALLALGSPGLFLIGLDRATTLARRALVFVTVLFVCGAPANAIFCLTMRDRFYVAAEPVADWLPWYPSGDWVLDVACGGHYLSGASVWTLRGAWLVLAIAVWVVSVWIFRWLLRYEWSW